MKTKPKSAKTRKLTVKDLKARKKGSVRGGASAPTASVGTPFLKQAPRWIMPCV